MARRSLRRQIEELADRLEPDARKRFLDAVQDLRSGVSSADLIAALDSGDITGAIEALNIDPAVFRDFSRTVESAYLEAGSDAASFVTRRVRRDTNDGVVVRFDADNPRAERQIREFGTRRIAEDVVPDIRDGARLIIEQGYAQGRDPRSIGRDLVGRVSRSTGRLEGGTIGLSRNQSDYVASMRARLASGDPGEMSKVFGMKRRDKRFDATIRKAIEEGKAPTRAQIDRMTNRYTDRLTQLRGEMIARTEVGEAVQKAQHEAFNQGLEKTGYSEQAVIRRWRHSGLRGEDARQDHIDMNGTIVQGMTEPFVLPDGTRMMHPLDASLGAGPGQIIGCRCSEEIDIDFSESLDG